MIQNVRLSAIAAIAENRALGRDNKLLFKIPEDFERMKQLTIGHPIIMGRRTFESIGRPLPGRLNLVISRDPTKTQAKLTNLIFLSSLDAAIGIAKKEEELRINKHNKNLLNTKYQILNTSPEVFIFGGGQIYKQALPETDRLYLTIIHKKVDADTFFPDYSEFKKVIEKKVGESKGLEYTFLTLAR